MNLSKLIADEKNAHLLLLLLATINLLLIVILFFLLIPSAKQILPKISPISDKTPIVRLNLISPQGGSTVSDTVPLVTTLSNGPKIVKAELYVDGQKVQTVTSLKTEKITLFWNTTKHPDGYHDVLISVIDNQEMLSSLSTSFNVRNNVSRNVQRP